MKPYKFIDLKPYQPLGMPLLYFLFGLTALSLILVVIYEYFL